MKHTYFFAQTRAIKEQEYKELYAAVEAHNGIYEWDLTSGNYPTIAVNVNSIGTHPTDMDISKVSIEKGVLKIYGEDKEYGNGIDFKPEDAFAGHLSSVIDYIPPVNGVEDVTCKQKYLPVIHLSRDDISSRECVRQWDYAEVLADIAYEAGCQGYQADENSRATISNLVSWADEFSRLHKDTDWTQTEYLDTIYDFTDNKLKSK